MNERLLNRLKYLLNNGYSRSVLEFVLKFKQDEFYRHYNWLARERKRNLKLDYIVTSEILKLANREKIDLLKFSYYDAMEMLIKFNYNRSKGERPPNIVYSDEEMGHYIIKLSADECDKEGRRMKNCISSYKDNIAEGDIELFSLRSRNNLPHAIIELQLDYIEGMKIIGSIKAASNRRPALKYIRTIVRFIRYLQKYHGVSTNLNYSGDWNRILSNYILYKFVEKGYDYVEFLHGSYYSIGIKNSNKLKYGVVNIKGEKIIPAEFYNISGCDLITNDVLAYYPMNLEGKEQIVKGIIYKNFDADSHKRSKRAGFSQFRSIKLSQSINKYSDEDALLKNRVLNGAVKRYGEEIPSNVKSRIENELSVIKKSKSSLFFIVLHDFIKYAKEKNIFIGPGKGASAGSIVNYCLEITAADPLKFGLLFERFFDPRSGIFPETYLDIGHRKIHKVIKYFTNECKKANAPVFIKSDLGLNFARLIFPAKYLGEPIPFKENNINNSGNYYNYFHPVDNKLYEMDFNSMEILIKISSCINIIKEKRYINLDISEIPLNDKAAFSLFQRGDINGIFLFKSDKNKKIIRELCPTSIDDISVFYSLSRPGPIAIGLLNEYILRKNNPDKIKYIHPLLENYLKDTLGLLVYQEQAMLIAQELGCFTPSESNKLRKAQGKLIPEIINELELKFIKGSSKNKIDSKSAEKIFNMMSKEGIFSFNKAHTVSYAFISYWSAFLKANYRQEFEESWNRNN